MTVVSTVAFADKSSCLTAAHFGTWRTKVLVYSLAAHLLQLLSWWKNGTWWTEVSVEGLGSVFLFFTGWSFYQFFSLLFSLHQPCSVFNLFLLCLGVFLCAVAPFEPVFTVAVWVKRAKYHGIILIKKKGLWSWCQTLIYVGSPWPTDLPRTLLLFLTGACQMLLGYLTVDLKKKKQTHTRNQPNKNLTVSMALTICIYRVAPSSFFFFSPFFCVFGCACMRSPSMLGFPGYATNTLNPDKSILIWNAGLQDPLQTE